MSDDLELLRRYVSEKSEEAFAALVRQHLGLVYHTALRHLHGDAHAAEDVAQAVFTDLARKAPSLLDRPLLAGWLHTSARYAALQRRRTERRRFAREQEAHLMHEITQPTESSTEWEQLRGVIDEALHALNARDREAVLMRFFEGCDFAEVGARLALSPQGARSCVERALAKMQGRLSRRGVGSTVAALSVILTSHAAGGAPVALAESVTRNALGAVAAGATGGAAFTLGTLNLVKASSLLLAGSIAANAVFGVIFLRDTETSPPSGAPVATLPAASTKVSAREQAATTTTVLLTDPVEIGRRLRAEGFSDRVVTSAVRSAVSLEFRDVNEAQSENRQARLRRWNPSPQLSVAVAPGLAIPKPVDFRTTPEALRVKAVMAELGYDASGVSFASLYHNLSAEKAVAVRKLEEDYQAIRQAGVIRVGNSSSTPRTVLEKVATEFERDLRALLSPQEADDYFRYDSDTGKQVQRALGNLKVSDKTYATIADAALDVAREQEMPSANPTEAARRQLGLIQTYRRELGDEQFLQALPRLPDGKTFAPADAIYQEARLPAGTRADLFVTFEEATLSAGARLVDPILVASRLYTALTTGAGLTPAQIAAFDATRIGERLKRAAATTTVRPPSSP